jgi:hypothetical protein
MTEYKRDIAVSAVGYDSLLVADLVKRLQPRLDGAVVWAAKGVDLDNDAALSLLGVESRVVLVVLHRLWSHEPSTAADSGILRQRMRKRPKSVVVLALEGATVPSWLESAHVHDLRTEGIDPLIETLLAAVSAQGGVVRLPEVKPELVAPVRAFGGEQPFLTQPRAQNALKKELERMFGEIESRLDADSPRESGDTVELSSAPNRYIARQGSAAISFSWLGGRMAGVADGRLLVIEWDGVAPRDRGMSTLKSAKPRREITYQPEGTGPDSWCWRDGDANGRACSTIDLVGEWLDGFALTAREPVVVAVA